MRIIKEENVGLASFCSDDSGIRCSEYCCPTFFRTPNLSDQHTKVDAVTLSFPSPIISSVENVTQDDHISHLEMANSEDGNSKSCNKEASTSKALRDVHISGRLMEDFLELAKENTEKDLETCGVLGASFKKNIFYVTTLIIPKQESTSSSCQASNEEEVFTIQNEHSLFPVGWIHTHPTQSCFMSSVDLHTQFSYQVMVPEAFAIVMAPTDTSRVFISGQSSGAMEYLG
ncbi:AMSH-like ubiquitin thioesterase 2 isoform X2 [Morus notabilis]|uniref:AMSH-like ubiquitin thioesterase 2 isoform X2 n=1 Tax=Morus notabilis TaxID=981085 RepID=UPI000CED4F5C|nr:AMSH-like ubiquitin thioesterase 2 isoform X2 [Morus notabilis]